MALRGFIVLPTRVDLDILVNSPVGSALGADGRMGIMLNHAGRSASRMLVVVFVAGVYQSWERDAMAQSTGDLPSAAEPWLAEPGDWAADFNDAQIACYEGSMRACDSIWLDNRVLMDTFLGDYGRTCGGRVDLREIRLANVRCTEAFPENE